MAHSESKKYSSGTESQIDLKLGFKLKFACCLKIYLRKLIKFHQEVHIPFIQLFSETDFCCTSVIMDREKKTALRLFSTQLNYF